VEFGEPLSGIDLIAGYPLAECPIITGRFDEIPSIEPENERGAGMVLTPDEEAECQLHQLQYVKPIQFNGSRNSAGQHQILIDGAACFISEQAFRILLLLAQRAITENGGYVLSADIAAIPCGPKRVAQAVSRLRRELWAVLTSEDAKNLVEGCCRKPGGYRLSTHRLLVKVDVAKLRAVHDIKDLVSELFPGRK